MWHRASRGESPCLETYELSWPGTARMRVWKRDRGECARCGRFDREWHVDHKKRLADGGSFAMDNLQTLCRGCHQDKTGSENMKNRQEI